MSTALKTACVALMIATPSFTFGSPFRPILRPSFVAEGPKSLKAEVAPEDGTTLGLSLGEFMRRAAELHVLGFIRDAEAT
jgi:hypothetical protein